MVRKEPFSPVSDGESSSFPVECEIKEHSVSGSCCSENRTKCKKQKQRCITLCGLLYIIRSLNRKQRSSSGEHRNLEESSTDDSFEKTSVSNRKLAFEGTKNQEASSLRKTTGNKKQNVQELKSDLARLLDNEESVGKSNYDSDDVIVGKMRRNSGNLARERRKKGEGRRGSNHSDSDSNSSAVSSLSSASGGEVPVLRRMGSREENKESSAIRNPHIKSYLHRNNSPKIEMNSAPNSPFKATRINYKEECSPGIVSSSGSLSSPAAAPRRKSSLHKEHNSSSPVLNTLSDLAISPTAVLHRKLSLDAANRARMSADSGTGTASTVDSRNSTASAGNQDTDVDAVEQFKRGGSFSASTGKIPPPPPPISDKPTTRPRSASSTPLPTKLTPPPKPSTPPPPPPTARRNNQSRPISIDSSRDEKESQGSSTTISSGFSLLSSPDAPFNAEEEYNRIMTSISTPTDTRHSFRSRKDSDSPTEEPNSDSDTKNRNSLDVPSIRDNDSCSDMDVSDAEDDGNRSVGKNDNESFANDTPKKEPLEVKLHNIAKELLSTEITYVEVLNLIDQIFHKRVMEAVNKKQISSEIKSIFSNVSAIYQFHSGFLLPQLQKRLENWDTDARLGDIMKQAAPFLKMYSLYVQNFDEAMNLIKIWSEKSSNFSSIIKQTQALPECKCLSLQHHMLGPVQRIPRYKMLLEDYLKRLSEDSPDRPDAEKAQELISIAATHSNETMKQSDKFHKLLNVYNNLLDINFDIVDVSRVLLLEGKITKISARNGEKHERYLYLFNDMLLCCTPVRRLQGKSYKVTYKIELDGIELTEAKNMTIPNTFCVNGTQKSMEFATNSLEEKEKWVNAINDAIDSFLERKTSFMKSGSQKRRKNSASEDLPPNSPMYLAEPSTPIRAVSPLGSPTHAINFEEIDNNNEEKRIEITCTPGTQYVVDIEDHDLGKRAPRWIKDNEVTMCMHCSKAFNMVFRRRHHCRACGRVICTDCSTHKLELQYDRSKSQKVCNKCFATLTGRKHVEGEVEKRGVLGIEADIVSENSVISEYLHFTESEKKKAWAKTWCVVPKQEPCLYVYGAHQDVRAMMTMPLPGFSVVEDSSLDRKFSFKLVQGTKCMLFSASSRAQMSRWIYVFRKTGQGEDVTREEVYDLRKDNISQSGDSTSNGMRLSSSSADSSTASSESSRPSSLMDRNDSYVGMNENSTQKHTSAVFTESIET